MVDGLMVPQQEVCQARTKSGGRCHMPVVAPGYPYCYLHIKDGTPITHDRYSNAMPTGLEVAHQHQIKDNKPKDLTQEIANLRAVLRTFYDDMKNNNKPLTPDDIQTILQISEGIGRTVERQSKISPDRVLTVPQAMTAISKIVDSINARIPAENMAVREAIVRDIREAVSELVSGATDFVYGNNHG